MSKRVPHFWFMTIQTPNGAGYRINSYQGVLTPEPGTTRLSLFNEVRAEIDHRDQLAIGGAVIAFDVQPNRLRQPRLDAPLPPSGSGASSVSPIGVNRGTYPVRPGSSAIPSPPQPNPGGPHARPRQTRRTRRHRHPQPLRLQ